MNLNLRGKRAIFYKFSFQNAIKKYGNNGNNNECYMFGRLSKYLSILNNDTRHFIIFNNFLYSLLIGRSFSYCSRSIGKI